MFGNSVSCAYHTFPGTVHTHDRELLTDHHLDLNTLHLFVHQGSFKKGAGELDLSAGPLPKAGIYWAQGLYGPVPKDGMGLGPGPVWAWDLGAVQY